MPIPITCTGCQVKLKAPDAAAGKKIKCPKCQTVNGVPVAPADDGAVTKKSSADVSLPAKTKSDHWFLQTPDGSQYGPVPKEEMDQWFSEGRVSADCQLLKEGGTQWRWASELYPALAQLAGAAVSGSAVSGGMSAGGTATMASPLTALSSKPDFTDLPGLSPLDSIPSTSTATLPSYTSGTAPTYSAPLASTGLAANPYATSATAASYGGYQQRSGPHPLVIVAGIFHILSGVSNIVLFIGMMLTALMLLLAGGTAAAAGAGADEAQVQGLAGGLAAFGIIGSIVVFLIAVGFLVYGIAQIWASIGLFRRQRSAKVATFVFASLGALFVFFSLGMLIIGGGFFWAFAFLGELVYVAILFVAMCLPDATRDFR